MLVAATPSLVRRAAPRAIMRIHTVRMGKLELEKRSPLVYVAPAPVKPATLGAPNVVLICGWMDGQLRYVSKYAEQYRAMYPGASIIMVLSTYAACFESSFAARQAEAHVAAVELRARSAAAHAAQPSVPPTVLLHTMSNGGVIMLEALLQQLDGEEATFARPLAHIVDSAPGALDWDTLARAATATMPTDTVAARIRRHTRFASIALGAIAAGAVRSTRGSLEVLKRARQRINTTAMWAWRRGEAAGTKLPARMYFYTRADPFIQEDALLAHARDAQAVNRDAELPVLEMEKREAVPTWPSLVSARTRVGIWDTPLHCAIARHKPDLYWGMIEAFVHEAHALPVAPSKL